MAYNPKDYYFQKAKKENYAARSVFKLKEIDQRFKILKPGFQVLDLGAAPGSWSQYAALRVKGFGNPPKSKAPVEGTTPVQKRISGKVLGIDLQPIKITLPNALFLQGDMREMNLKEVVQTHGIQIPFDVILSDMAPKTTGIRVIDQTRSVELCYIALGFAEEFLKLKGHFVCKLFHSGDFEQFRDRMKESFRKVEILRPKSTRKESKEIFFIGMEYLGKKE